MNVKRALKQAKSRFNSKLELLAAAYLKESNIPASEARLCRETRGNVLHLWFERNEARANIADTHPDIQWMMSLLQTYHTYSDSFTDAQRKEFNQMVSDLMGKYEGHYQADTIAPQGRTVDDRSLGELVDGNES